MGYLCSFHDVVTLVLLSDAHNTNLSTYIYNILNLTATIVVHMILGDFHVDAPD